MLIFAIIGVVVNGYAAWKLSKGKTLNERVISWHLLEDVLGWTAILIVSIVLHFKDIQYLDPALSLLITIYILWNVIARLKETLVIFLQGEPTDVDRAVIEGEILKIKNVESIHHTHIWSLDGEHHVFTTHLKLGSIQDLNEMLSIKNQVKEIMKKYPFEHYTIETEIDAERCGLQEDSGEHH
jgi:cobalt-zinc-cadmium efflux system protein